MDIFQLSVSQLSPCNSFSLYISNLCVLSREFETFYSPLDATLSSLSWTSQSGETEITPYLSNRQQRITTSAGAATACTSYLTQQSATVRDTNVLHCIVVLLTFCDFLKEKYLWPCSYWMLSRPVQSGGRDAWAVLPRDRACPLSCGASLQFICSPVS